MLNYSWMLVELSMILNWDKVNLTIKINITLMGHNIYLVFKRIIIYRRYIYNFIIINENYNFKIK